MITADGKILDINKPINLRITKIHVKNAVCIVKIYYEINY